MQNVFLASVENNFFSISVWVCPKSFITKDQVLVFMNDFILFRAEVSTLEVPSSLCSNMISWVGEGKRC